MLNYYIEKTWMPRSCSSTHQTNMWNAIRRLIIQTTRSGSMTPPKLNELNWLFYRLAEYLRRKLILFMPNGPRRYSAPVIINKTFKRKLIKGLLRLHTSDQRRKIIKVGNKHINWKILKIFLKNLTKNTPPNIKTNLRYSNSTSVILKPHYKKPRAPYSALRYKARLKRQHQRIEWAQTKKFWISNPYTRSEFRNSPRIHINFAIIYTLIANYRHKKRKKLMGFYKKPRRKLIKQYFFGNYLNYRHVTKINFTINYARSRPSILPKLRTFKSFISNTISLGAKLQEPLHVSKIQKNKFWYIKNPQFGRRNIDLHAPVSSKRSIFNHIFSYVNTNLSINNLIVNRYIYNNSLLNTTTVAHAASSRAFLDKYIKNTPLFLPHVSNFYLAKFNCSHSLTNYYPIMYFFNSPKKKSLPLNLNIRHLYWSQMYSYKNNKYSSFYIFFLVTFLEQFLKKKIWVRADVQDFFTPYWRRYLNSKMYSRKLNLNQYTWYTRILPVSELYDIIIIMFVMRDPQIFLYFLKHCFEKAHFKKHKKILSILFNILRQNKDLLNKTNVRGFFFDIRGKVGVSGNAKKRHLSFSLNKTTSTSQNVRSQWRQLSIWTPTGQMGMTCYILY